MAKQHDITFQISIISKGLLCPFKSSFVDTCHDNLLGTAEV